MSVLSHKKKESQMDTEYAFTHLPIPQALAKFMIPTIISQLTFLFLNLADAFFVGRTGDTYQISAMAITFPLGMMMACFCTVFATGGNSNIASCLGLGQREQAKKFATFSIYTAIGVNVIYAVVLVFLWTPILSLLGASEASIGFCKDYLFWTVLLSCFPISFNQVIAQMFLAEGESKIAGMGISISTILNIVLDPVFIFGLGMGIGGAGAATCISNYVTFLYFLYQWKKRRKTTIVCLNIRNYQLKDGICKKTLTIGVPAGLVLLLTNICDFVRNFYLGSLGSDFELAAWGAVQKIGNALMNIALGIAQGLRPLAAYNYASGAYRRTKKLISATMFIMAVYIGAALAVTHVAPELIVRLFVTDERAVGIAVYFLKVWTFAMIGIAFIELFNAVFQAFGKWKVTLVNTVINKGLMLTPVLILLVQMFGIRGVPFSQVITENIAAVALLIVYVMIAKRLVEDV